MLAWFSDLTTRERRTMTACFGGWSLDALDVQVFSFVIPSLLALWKITAGQAGELATVTLLVSAFGGWLAGAACDRFGRVRVLQVTIVWYAVFTFLCGFAQNFEQLFIFRALQGLGFGGEWAAGAVLMGEVIRDKYRGRAVGIVQTGWSIGWGAAALLYTILIATLPEALAWRALFWIGILPAGLVFWIRRFVEEPVLNQRHAAPAGILHIFSALKPPYLSTTWRVALMVAGAQGGSYALTIWLPTYLKTVRHISSVGTGSYLMVLILGAFFGFVSGAYLADGIGRKPTFMISAIGSVALDDRLSVRPDRQRDDPAGGLPAGIRLADHVLADGLVHDRAVSYRGARCRPGVLLQCGARDRRAVPGGGRLPGGAVRVGPGNRGVQPERLWLDDRGAAAAAGNARPVAGQPGTARDGVTPESRNCAIMVRGTGTILPSVARSI